MKNKTFSNNRCVICNCVSHAEISDDFGNFSSKPFYRDEVVGGIVCFECRESYQGALSEFEDFDDDNLGEDPEDLFNEIED